MRCTCVIKIHRYNMKTVTYILLFQSFIRKMSNYYDNFLLLSVFLLCQCQTISTYLKFSLIIFVFSLPTLRSNIFNYFILIITLTWVRIDLAVIKYLLWGTRAVVRSSCCGSFGMQSAPVAGLHPLVILPHAAIFCMHPYYIDHITYKFTLNA